MDIYVEVWLDDNMWPSGGEFEACSDSFPFSSVFEISMFFSGRCQGNHILNMKWWTSLEDISQKVREIPSCIGGFLRLI